jgi:trk system potassium uptake protein
MHPATICRMIGIFLICYSPTFLPPMLVSLIYDDGCFGVFGQCTLVSLLAGITLWFPVRKIGRELSVRDAFFVVSMFWTVLSAISALPFVLITDLSWTDAIFESVSGFTTTGATVMSGLDQDPKSLLYHRQQLHFLGGMGIIVLAVAILPMLGIGGMQLFRAETPGPMKEEKLTPRIAHTARSLWALYIGLTLLCTACFWIGGMNVFDAICHAYATISTGGFTPHDASFAYFNSPLLELIAIVFMLLGGINFALHYISIVRRRPLIYLQDSEALTFLMIVLVVSLGVAAVLKITGVYASPSDAFRHAAFQVVSFITTTGFFSADYASWPLSIPVVLVVVCYFGGCAGSTTGGFKIIRSIIIFKQVLREMAHLLHPKIVMPIKVNGRSIPDRVTMSVGGFMGAYLGISVVLTLLLINTGLSALDAFGAVAVTLNGTGPGLGSLSSNFSSVSDFGTWVLTLAMLIGRLEVFSLILLFAPMFWKN